MSTLTLPNPTFTPNTTADATQVTANNTAITTWANGNIDNTNIAAGANIALSKLNLSSGTTAFLKSTSGTQTWASGLTTDTQPRMAMTSDGGFRLGAGGVTAVDTEIIRSAAKTLQFNDTASGAITLDLNLSTITACASIALKNTHSATITPAALAADRAVTMPDPGGAANLYLGGTLSNHQIVKFDGSLFQGIAPGTGGNRLTSNGTDWVSSAPFQSTDQTITAGGTLTLPHSLGYAPKQVWYALVNVSGEANYTAGQVVFCGGMTTGTANQGFSAIVDATNLTIRFGSAATTFSLPDATTGAAAALTNADWHIRFFAI